jgi:hypothetical protein
VISHGKKKNELPMLAGESGKDGKDDKGKCHICGRENHKMKQCWYHDPAKTLEENKKIAQKKSKQNRKKRKRRKKNARSKQMEENNLLQMTLRTKVYPIKGHMRNYHLKRNMLECV